MIKIAALTYMHSNKHTAICVISAKQEIKKDNLWF